MSNQRETIALLVGKVADFVAALKASDPQEGQDKGEMCANAMLALRHLEDAAMRFGKVIQASAGGTSPLGGPATPSQIKN